MKTYSKFAFLIITVLLLITGNLFAQHQDIAGFGTEIEVKTYPFDGIPFLQNFYYRFTSDDRHILQIEVNPGSPEANKITLSYFDDTRDDEYFYTIAHYIVPITGVQTNKISSTFSGTEVRVISKPGPDYKFILIGFRLGFSLAEDHHIDEIGILEDDREDDATVTIFFNDQNDDDVFIYEIEYAWVPNSFFQSTGEETGTVDDGSGGDRRSVPKAGGIPVIRGFKFNYEEGSTSGDDHHLQEIGVLTTSTPFGDLEVYYSDQYQDDDFEWEVRWAILKPIAVGPNAYFFDRAQSPEARPPRLPLFLMIGLVILLIIIAVFAWRRRRV